ncbi:hypothetical protein ONE63_008745 [Megalurothrips usitatus]|uniref:STAS domain-containing protein n=1 Tax=Megalurothrips usitatus TaxID=439358 RepID=A0AAV7XRD5_9NEOP|nr:hypothetical protein ONE63_008745 [Megalurothrips usitatus]
MCSRPAADGPRAPRGPRWLLRRLPLLVWLPAYTSGVAVADLVAGLTLGLTMMPQSIAYAQLAGVDPQYGLYSAAVGGFVYTLLGSIKQVVIGPASIMSIVTLQFTRGVKSSIAFVNLLTFFSGLVQLAMAVLRLGFLVDFISTPVVSAFTSATAIIIMVAQLRPLLGLRFDAHGCVETLVGVAQRIREVRLADTGLGVASMAFLLSFKLLSLVPADPKRPAGRALWFLSISKNALCITIATVMAGQLHASKEDTKLFAVVEHMPPGLPPFSLPPFGGATTADSRTFTFPEMLGELGVGLLVTPVVGMLINVAIGKAYEGVVTVDGKLDASQEMLALGSCNLLGSFMQAMPVSGALTRSAVAEASGVRTPLAGLYCSLLIVAALAWLTPHFYFIPRTTLAAVLIVAVGSLIDIRIVPRLWRTSKRDLAVLVATFLTCLWLGVEVGLVLGMAMDATRLLQPWARPSMTDTLRTTEAGAEYVLVRPSLGVLYPGVDVVRQHAVDAAAGPGRRELAIVVDCSTIVSVDYTAAVALVSLAGELGERGQRLLLLGPTAEARAALRGAGLPAEAMCAEHELHDALRGERGTCGRGAPPPLLQAQSLICLCSRRCGRRRRTLGVQPTAAQDRRLGDGDNDSVWEGDLTTASASAAPESSHILMKPLL